MRKLLLLFVALTLASGTVYAKKDKSLKDVGYEIEGSGTGAQGTYLVTVTVVTNDNKLDDDVVKACAVHGVLFKGFVSKENRQHQRPLAGSATAEAEHADFYDNFFGESNSYAKYADVVTGSRKVIKSGKKYKVTNTVTVYKDQLKKDLENAGAIDGLNNIF